VFWIASLTNAITSLAALQRVQKVVNYLVLRGLHPVEAAEARPSHITDSIYPGDQPSGMAPIGVVFREAGAEHHFFIVYPT
jgi:hypothetical protein